MPRACVNWLPGVLCGSVRKSPVQSRRPGKFRGPAIQWTGNQQRIEQKAEPVQEWFLTPDERGNPATRLDRRRGDGLAWSTGNDVRPLIHGATYFDELAARVGELGAGDLLLFTDWRGDPDERLREHGPAVAQALCGAAKRGVRVAGLIWRSHLDKLAFSAEQNRHLGDDIEAVGGECLLDMRVRTGGSHHMKMVVLRHQDHPERDRAFVGGIDLCHSRRDDRPAPRRPPEAADGQRLRHAGRRGTTCRP